MVSKIEALERENNILKAEVAGWQRGEAKIREAMDKVYDERDNWKRNCDALKARAEKAEKELAIAQDTCGKACRGERRTYLEKEQAELRTEEAEAKLAGIEKDLRERRLTQYELLLEHFPDKKGGK